MSPPFLSSQAVLYEEMGKGFVLFLLMLRDRQSFALPRYHQRITLEANTLTSHTITLDIT